jgi:hypothetical protein
MNLKFAYLYRDGANYKNFNEVIFSNPNSRSVKDVESLIKMALIDEAWFVAKDWNLPDIHFKEYPWDPETDHEWHEFEFIQETLERVTENISIEDFLVQTQREKR